jgi:hypothetical protein
MTSAPAPLEVERVVRARYAAAAEAREAALCCPVAYEPGPCFEANQAVLYRGPWKRVEDDDGHVLQRGQRSAVCARTYERLCSPPYSDHVIAIAPRVAIPEAERELFDCARTAPRDPRETKGRDGDESRQPSSDGCGPQGCC